MGIRVLQAPRHSQKRPTFFFAAEDLCKNPSEKVLGKSGKVFLAQSDMAILRNKGIFP